MRVRWFGEPWPSSEERAPICEENTYQVPTPVGIRCIGCAQPVEDGERGIVMAYGGDGEQGVTFHLEADYYGARNLVCAEHIDCMIRSVLGPDAPIPFPRQP